MGFFVVVGSVVSQFENFSSEVFKNGSEVNGSIGIDMLGVVIFVEKMVDMIDRESEIGFGGMVESRYQFFECEEK